MKKILEHICLTLALLGALLCACALVASVADSRDAEYLGLHLMDDRHPAKAHQHQPAVMTVWAPAVEDAQAGVPQSGRAAASPPSPLTQGGRPMVKDHPLDISGPTGPLAALNDTGANDPDCRALLKSTGGWNRGMLGGLVGE